MSRTPRDGFIGRDPELDRILQAALKRESAAIISEPAAGSSELLRQASDTLFFSQRERIPFYFEITEDDNGSHGLGSRFIRELLTQTVAFRRQDPSLIASSPSIDRLGTLAASEDFAWIDDTIDALRNADPDGTAFLRNCFGALAQAASKGAKLVWLLDGTEQIARFHGDNWFFETLSRLAATDGLSIVVAGHRRCLYGKTEFPNMAVDRLSLQNAGRLAEYLSGSLDVAINEQTRDLIAIQLDGDPGAITSLFRAAAGSRIALDTFEKVETVYTDQIFAGQITKKIERSLERAIPNTDQRLRFISILLDPAHAGARLDHIERQLGIRRTELEILHQAELIDLGPVHAKLHPSILAGDHMRAVLGLNSSVKRGLVVGETLAENIRRGPQLMARVYRKLAALDLRDLLARFDGRKISAKALEYGLYREHKGLSDEDTLSVLAAGTDDSYLPRILYTVAAESLYPPLADLLSGRAAVGIGFDEAGDDIAVIAAQIESKLEAARDVTEFWCDRLEMLAINCGLERYKIWLIAPEGFDEEAISALKERGAYGSSIRQVLFMDRLLRSSVETEPAIEEYELTIPMGKETELIAAKTVEEIASRHGLTQKATNQIKTALVEACINAAEHSLSPEQKIHHRFKVEKDRLVMTISNRGLRLQDAKAPSSSESRRGWGLQLMRSLMDEVRIDNVDDGTSITLIKNFG